MSSLRPAGSGGAAEHSAGTMKWWGWGSPAKRAELGPEAAAMLRSELGEAEPAPRVELEQVALPAPRPLPAEISRAVGPAAVLNGHEHRVRRAAGRSYPDLVRLRAGRLEDAPDAVVLPGSVGEVARILEICSREGVAVVPFGGGTSVVGGVEPLRGGFESSALPGSPATASGRRRSALSDRDPGPRAARAGGRGGAPGAGDDAGALPAVVRIRDDRRLRGHPLRRAGVERLWPLRRAGDVDRAHRAGRRPANARDSAQRRRPGAARARDRLRGGAGADHAGDREGPSASGAAALRGVDGRRLRLRRRDRSLARAGRRTPGCAAPLRPGGDATLAGALGAPPGPSAPCCRATCACAAGPAAA